MPAIPWTECFIASPPGIPIEDAPRLPGQAFPKNGKMIPTDGPGFGLDIDISKLEILS
jgi:L-rhamnonate dehydratase